MIVICGKQFHSRALHFPRSGLHQYTARSIKNPPSLVPRTCREWSACASTELSEKENAIHAVEGAVEVYNLAADMGGMGFIERFRVECLRSVLINTHMIEAAYRAGVRRYFFSSSACAYNTTLQQDPNSPALKESDAHPAMADRGYGWEKLISETFCQEYWAENGAWNPYCPLPQRVCVRMWTSYGGREKGPCSSVPQGDGKPRTGALLNHLWGDGSQTRSFMYIDDCALGIDLIMHCNESDRHPINLGSSELVSI